MYDQPLHYISNNITVDSDTQVTIKDCAPNEQANLLSFAISVDNGTTDESYAFISATGFIWREDREIPVYMASFTSTNRNGYADTSVIFDPYTSIFDNGFIHLSGTDVIIDISKFDDRCTFPTEMTTLIGIITFYTYS